MLKYLTNSSSSTVPSQSLSMFSMHCWFLSSVHSLSFCPSCGSDTCIRCCQLAETAAHRLPGFPQRQELPSFHGAIVVEVELSEHCAQCAVPGVRRCHSGQRVGSVRSCCTTENGRSPYESAVPTPPGGNRTAARRRTRRWGACPLHFSAHLAAPEARTGNRGQLATTLKQLTQLLGII